MGHRIHWPHKKMIFPSKTSVSAARNNYSDNVLFPTAKPDPSKGLAFSFSLPSTCWLQVAPIFNIKCLHSASYMGATCNQHLSRWPTNDNVLSTVPNTCRCIQSPVAKLRQCIPHLSNTCQCIPPAPPTKQFKNLASNKGKLENLVYHVNKK